MKLILFFILRNNNMFQSNFNWFENIADGIIISFLDILEVKQIVKNTFRSLKWSVILSEGCN